MRGTDRGPLFMFIHLHLTTAFVSFTLERKKKEHERIICPNSEGFSTQTFNSDPYSSPCCTTAFLGDRHFINFSFPQTLINFRRSKTCSPFSPSPSNKDFKEKTKIVFWELNYKYTHEVSKQRYPKSFKKIGDILIRFLQLCVDLVFKIISLLLGVALLKTWVSLAHIVSVSCSNASRK